MPPPEHRLLRADGKIKVVVTIPDGVGVDQVDVELSEGGRQLVVGVPGCSALTIKLPSTVADDDMKAKFSKSKGQLTVSVPDGAAPSSSAADACSAASGASSGAADSAVTVPLGQGGGRGGDEAQSRPRAGGEESGAGGGSCCAGGEGEGPSESDDFRGQWAYRATSSTSAPTSAPSAEVSTAGEEEAGDGATSGGGEAAAGGGGAGGSKWTLGGADALGVPLEVPATQVNHAPAFLEDDIKEGEADPVPISLGVDTEATATGKRRGASKRRGSTRIEKAYNKRQLMAMAKSLKNYGWAVLDKFVPEDLIETVRDEIAGEETRYDPGEIWVGKEADVGAQITVKSVRGDKILWMTQEELEAKNVGTVREVMRAMDRLVIGELAPLADRLSNVTEHTDPMLAIFPGGGARFARHVDNTVEDGRRLTVLIYLNPGWKPEAGGALRVWQRAAGGGARVPVDILPEAGRLAMFYSDEIAHEVMPTNGTRHSLTVWYYDLEERVHAISDAKRAAAERMQEAAAKRTKALPAPGEEDAAGGKKAARKAERKVMRAQEEARAFIGDVMAVGDDAARPSGDGLDAISSRARSMSLQAQEIAAAVVGAPSVAHFQQAVSALTPESLLTLREQIARMGV